MTVSELRAQIGVYNISRSTIYNLINRQLLVARLDDMYLIDNNDAHKLIQSWKGRYCPKDYLLITEVMEILSISISTIHRYIQNQMIEAVKIGGEYCIKKEDMEVFLKAARVKQNYFKTDAHSAS